MAKNDGTSKGHGLLLEVDDEPLINMQAMDNAVELEQVIVLEEADGRKGQAQVASCILVAARACRRRVVRASQDPVGY